MIMPVNLDKKVYQKMSQEDHWEHVYRIYPIEKMGWYEPHLKISSRWIKEIGLAVDAPIIDVGGGASSLVDDLLEKGYRSVTVLDISERALSSAKTRLGEKANLIKWLHGDVTFIDLPSLYYDIWHDRALFHFLILPEEQSRYRHRLITALKPNGHVIIATFAPEAPPKCSGLPVQRYSPETLLSTLGEEFELIRHEKELHISPRGVEQMYLFCHFRKKD